MMPENEGEKKIIVDDDWKAQARKEKEQLAEETAMPESIPDPSFAELVNIIATQVVVGLGGMAGPGGERIPPNIEVAKHYIDMLQMLEEKTRNNLTDDEKKLLDQVLYELRLLYVQAAGGGAAPAAPGVDLPKQ